MWIFPPQFTSLTLGFSSGKQVPIEVRHCRFWGAKLQEAPPNPIPSEHRHLQRQLHLTHIISHGEWSPWGCFSVQSSRIVSAQGPSPLLPTRGYCTKRKNSPQTPCTGSGWSHEDQAEITIHESGNSLVTSSVIPQ